jgi:adenylate kinase family enzyme
MEHLPKDKFAALQEQLVTAGTWVIDGNYASSLPIRLKRAGIVIFLDLSPIACLRGIAQRQRPRRPDRSEHMTDWTAFRGPE